MPCTDHVAIFSTRQAPNTRFPASPSCLHHPLKPRFKQWQWLDASTLAVCLPSFYYGPFVHRLSGLPPDARAEDVQKLFDGYGRIVDCRVMTGFGFVEFESTRDAEDAVHHFNGKSFMGAKYD